MLASAFMDFRVCFQNGGNQVGVQRYPVLSDVANNVEEILKRLREQIGRLAEEEQKATDASDSDDKAEHP